MSDAETLALATSLALVDGQISAANNKVRTAGTKRQAQIERAWKALQDARKKASKKSGWLKFGNICKVVGIGASLAAAGATGGSSLLLTAALLTASMSAARVLGAMNMDRELVEIKGVKLKVSDAVAIGCIAGGAYAGTEDAKMSAFQKGVAIGARATQVGASGGRAVAAERAGHYEGAELNLIADSRESENEAKREQREIEQAISRLRESVEVRGRAIQAAMSIQETKDHALKAILRRTA